MAKRDNSAGTGHGMDSTLERIHIHGWSNTGENESEVVGRPVDMSWDSQVRGTPITDLGTDGWVEWGTDTM